MPATENPVDIDLFNSLQTEGEAQTTTKGKPLNSSNAFLKKCIHPPSAVPEYAGLPTNDARSQVVLEYRNMAINNTPVIYDSSAARALTPADLQSFDYAFLMPSGCRVLSIPFVFCTPNGAFTSNGWMQDLSNIFINQLYNYDNWAIDVNLYRPTYKSTTFSLNATMFNDTGIVVGNQFNPSILFSGAIYAFQQTKPSEFRDFVLQCHIGTRTIRPTEKELANWMSWPKYVREDLHQHCGLLGNEILGLDPNTHIQVANFSQSSSGAYPIPTSSQILGNSLRSYGGTAKEGAFSVHRINTIAPTWLANNTFNGNPGEQSGLYECYTYTVGSDHAPHYVKLMNTVNPGEKLYGVLMDTQWSSDMTWSWVRFSGLSLNSQTNVSTQLIIQKTYLGVEIQPAMFSAFAGLQRLAPKPDLQAMQALMDAFYDLKDVLPARYNFWGALAGLASQGLQTFGSALIDKLSKGSSTPAAAAPVPEVATPTKVKRETKHLERDDKRLDRLERLMEELLLSNRGGSRAVARRQGDDHRPRREPPRGVPPARPAPLAIMPAPRAKPKRKPAKKLSK